jgi:hypothetical protein
VKKHERAYFGISVALLISVGLLYYLTGRTTSTGLRWWAALATLAIPLTAGVTWLLTTQSAREHLAGFDRGLAGAEHTITAVGRGLSATASMARTAARSAPRPPAIASADDDLLPRPGQMRIIDALSSGDVINV